MGKTTKTEISWKEYVSTDKEGVEMDDLLMNTRPIFFGLIGFVFLYYSHLRTRKRWDAESPKIPSNLLLRLALACSFFVVVAFLFSAFFTTSIIYTFVNTTTLVIFFVLYLYRVFADARKYHDK